MAGFNFNQFILPISTVISVIMLIHIYTANYVVAEMSIISANSPSVSIASPSNSFAVVGQYESFNGIIASGYTPYNIYLYIVNSVTHGTIVYSENSLFTGPKWDFNGIQITSAWASNSPLIANVVVVDAHSVTTNSVYTAPFSTNSEPTASLSAPSNTILDHGQSVSYNALISAGVGPFNANLMVDNTLVESLTGLGVGTVHFDSNVPQQGTQSFNVVVTDTGLTTQYTFNSPTNSILVYPFSAALTSNPSNSITYGSNVVENAIVTGGSGNFVFGWAINGVVASNTPVGTYGSSNSLIIPSSGFFQYNVIVTDIGTNAPYEYLLSSNVIVAKAATSGSISINQQSIYATGSKTIGNQSKWTLYVNNALYSTANSQISVALSSLSTGTYLLSFRNPGNNNYTSYSANATLIIQNGGGAASTTTSGATGTGGSAGTGKPKILYINNQAVVIGISVPNPFNITLYGVRFNFTPNFITPTYAGMSVNGRPYSFYPGKPVLVSQNQNPDYIFYVKAFNLTITPIQNYLSVSVSAITNVTPVNVTTQKFSAMIRTSNTIPVVINLLGGNTSLNITSAFTANQIFSFQNLTNTRFIPPLPANYVALTIQNISVTPFANLSGQVNTTINVTMQYDCGIAFYRIFPFLLQNYTWSRISSYNVKPNKCVVTFSVPPDPIMAVAEYVGSNGIPTPTSITSSIITSSTTAATTIIPPTTAPVLNENQPHYQYLIALLIIALTSLIVYLLIRLRLKKPEKTPKRSQKAASKLVSDKPRREIKRTGKRKFHSARTRQ